jgi:RNA polymerase sigma-70 factor (ECF subfamily)
MLHQTRIPTQDPTIEEAQERVRGFVRRLVSNSHDCEEIVSQTLLALLEQIRTQRRVRKPQAWALRVAWNKVVDLRRRQRRSVERGQDVAHLPAKDTHRNRELREWLDAGLSYLPEADRALLHLRYSEELSDRDIAHVIGCPRGTVARRLHDARRRLGEMLERLDAGVSVASVLLLMGALGSLSSRTQAAMTLASLTGAKGSFAGVIAMKKMMAGIAAIALLGLLAWQLQEGGPGTAGRGSRDAEVADPSGVDGPARTEKPDGGGGSLETLPYHEATPPADPLRSIRGRVETPGGAPVAGARVAAFTCVSGMPIDLDDDDAPLFRGTTGEDGRFAIPVRASGRFDLVARTDTHAPGLLRDARLDDDVVITLEPSIEIRGRVVDLEGTPVGGARVSYRTLLAHARYARTVRADADGRFAVSGVPEPEPMAFPHLLVEAEGYAPRRKPIEKDPEEEILVHVTRGAIVEGRVMAAGAPLAGVEVVLWTNEDPNPGIRLDEGVWMRNPFGSRILLRTRTDSEGRYELPGVPFRIADINPLPGFTQGLPDGPGVLLGGVVAWKPGLAPANAPVRLPLREDDNQVLDLVLHPPARLEGRVIDLDGNPLPGVRVRPSAPGTTSFAVAGSPEPFGPWVETDAEGRWRFEHFPCPDGRPTPCVLQACGCPLGLGQDEKMEVLAIPGETVQVADLALDARRVHGRVVNAAGEAVEGASVRTPGAHAFAGAFTDSDGAFVLWRSRPASKLVSEELVALAAGYRTTEFPVPEDGSPVTVVLEPGASIKGRLRQADGTPARGIPLEAWPASEAKPKLTILRTTTGDDGGFVLQGLAQGSYVVARFNEPANPWQTTAQAGGPDVEGVLPPPKRATHDLTVRVLQASDRAPVATAQVLATRDGGAGKGLWSAAGMPQAPGVHRLTGLSAGPHVLLVKAPGFASVDRLVTVGDALGEDALEIVLGAGARVSGRVHFPPDVTVSHGATVTLLSEDGRKTLGKTDVAPDRTYSFAGFPPGSVLVRADAPAVGRGGTTRPPLTVARMVALRVGDGSQVCDLDLVLAARLELRFTGDPTSPEEPFPPVSIGLTGFGTSPGLSEAFIIDADGRTWETGGLSATGTTHRAALLPPGRYTVEVRKGDAVLCTTRVTAPGRATITIPDL